MKIKIGVIIIISIFCIPGCGKKMPLPTVESSLDSFGANDTSYIHLNPVWESNTIGYYPDNPMTPVDIAIGEDGYIFVADSANDKVLTISPSGHLVTHQNLNSITSVSAPKGIDIDSKLNLLIVNGTNTVYVWNQYINNIGVDSVLVGFSGDYKFVFSGDPAKIDSVVGINQFYTDENEFSSFQSVGFGPSMDSTIFITDNGNNRILQIKIEFNGAVKLKNGFLHPTFAGTYVRDIATYGSGAGTVDNPKGITVDNEGNIYFTQLGGNFLVQKLEKLGMNYSSQYTLYQDPIMDLNRFHSPFDIALDNNDAIFVIDTEEGKAYKFFNRGNRAGQIVDIGKTGLADVIFNHPYAIAISDNDVVYVADTGNHKIERYQLSVSEDDLPIEQPN